MVYNYIDPDIVKSYLAHNISGLNNAERQSLLQVIRTNQLGRFMAHEMEIPSLRAMAKVKAILNKARELADKAGEFENTPRVLKLTLKGIKKGYSYSRFVVDSSCGLGCEFKAVEEKDIPDTDIYQEDLELSPYSVNFIILKKKPDETKDVPKG
jgi:hypothetical protein